MTKNYQYHFKPQHDRYPYVREIPNPVEFFCPRKYQGYHVRGQSLFLPYATSEDMRQNAPLRFYQMQLVVLIKDDVPWTGGRGDYRFGIIIGETKTEFEDFRKRKLLFGFKGNGSKKEEYPIPVTVKNSVMEITSTPYLKQNISDQQDIILVSFEMLPIYVTDSEEKESWEPPTPSIHQFLACYWMDGGILGSGAVKQWFSEIHDIFCLDLNYRGMSKREFIDSLKIMGNLACGVSYGDIGKSDINLLNELLAAKDESGDPLKKFCFSFVTSMKNSLCARELIKECLYCGDFMLTYPGKKYCSFRVEGKDCAKKARNKAFYARRDQRTKVVKKEDTEDFKRYQRNIKHLEELGLLKKPPKSQIQYTKKKVKKKKLAD